MPNLLDTRFAAVPRLPLFPIAPRRALRAHGRTLVRFVILKFMYQLNADPKLGANISKWVYGPTPIFGAGSTPGVILPQNTFFLAVASSQNGIPAPDP